MKGPRPKITPDVESKITSLRLSGDLHARISRIAKQLKISNNAFILKQLVIGVQAAELELFGDDK